MRSRPWRQASLQGSGLAAQAQPPKPKKAVKDMQCMGCGAHFQNRCPTRTLAVAPRVPSCSQPLQREYLTAWPELVCCGTIAGLVWRPLVAPRHQPLTGKGCKSRETLCPPCRCQCQVVVTGGTGCLPALSPVQQSPSLARPNPVRPEEQGVGELASAACVLPPCQLVECCPLTNQCCSSYPRLAHCEP